MSKFALNIAEDGRILSATLEEYAPEDAVLVTRLPSGDITQYKYSNGGYTYDPLPEPDPEPQQPSENTVTADDILNTLLGVTE